MSTSEKPTSSRRSFVKKLVASAAAATAAVAYVAAKKAPEETAEKKRQVHYGMLIDTRKCIGCHTCSVACKSEFDLPLGVYRSWVEYTEKGRYPDVSRHFLPRLCNHCSNPQCVTVCPTGATYKRPQDGVVVVDSGVCIGCKYCAQACPYDARFLNPVTGFIEKCDFCIHRVENGLVPSCVNSCIGGARIFGDINDPNSEIAQKLATNPTTVLRPGKGTEPNVFYIDADHSDEHDNKHEWHHVSITTHRPNKERR